MKQLFLLSLLLLCAPLLRAQQVGSKVIMQDANGSWYTGTVKEITGGKYRVVYDNTDFEAWLQAGQFTLTANPSTYTSYKTGGQGARESGNQVQTARTTQTTSTTTAKPSTGNVPTEADIIAKIRETWERKQTSFEASRTVVVNKVTIGSSQKANLQNEYDGIPKGALVTNAKIDFTYTTHYSSGPKPTRMIMTAYVYRDAFGEWAVMSNGTVYPQD